MPPSFLETVLNTISAHDMLKPGMTVLAGVSGGPDSMALLDTLVAISGSFSLRLGVAHLNHGLRGVEAGLDADFVKTVAKRHGLPYFGQYTDVRAERKRTGRSLEEAARDVRHRFLHQVAKCHGYEKIALGHHRDDHAEQVLMNLIRGTGPDGLCGIAPVRGIIIRPLIRSSRADILDYLSCRSLDFRTDCSNEDPRFLRNRIRLKLLPELKHTYNPGIVDGLNRLGEILQSEKAWISGLVDAVFDRIVCLRENEKIEMGIEDLLQCHAAVQRRVVRKAIKTVKGELRRITLAHVESVMDLIKTDQHGASIDLPDRIRAARNARRLIISREKGPLRSLAEEEPGPGAYAHVLSESRVSANQPVFIPEAGIFLSFEKIPAPGGFSMAGIKKEDAFMDLDKLTFPLCVRNFRPGDRFAPLGLKGSQKLKKFFIDHRVGRIKRKTLPLLVSGNDIVWTAGLRIAEAVKITPATRMVLRASIKATA